MTLISASLFQDLIHFFLNTLPRENRTTLPTYNNTYLERMKVIKASMAATSRKDLGHSLVIDSSKGSSHGFKTLQGKTQLISYAPRVEQTPPDAHSEATGQCCNKTSSSAGLKAKGKAHSDYHDESSSVGDSSNTNLCKRKYHDDTYQTTCLSDNDEESEYALKEKLVQKGNKVKRSRNARIHTLHERKRRDKINKKMRILKGLIPNCNKMDQVSMLDHAIEYIKTLKLQLQIMSMGGGLCMPLMMLNTSHLAQFMGAGMGFRPQFPIAPFDNGVGMFGFPNQFPHIPNSHSPFIPMVGNPHTQQFLATSTSTKMDETTAVDSVPKKS